MAYLAGEPIIDVLTLRTPAGVLVTGATWSVLFSQRQDGTAFTTTVEETTSPGTYLISSETDGAGAYHRIVTAVRGVPDDEDYHLSAYANTARVVDLTSPFEHYVDADVEEVLYLIDAAGTGLADQTLTTEAGTANDPNGDAFTLTATAIPDVDGGYLVTMTPDVAGVWSAELTADTTPERRFRFDVVVADHTPLIDPRVVVYETQPVAASLRMGGPRGVTFVQGGPRHG